MKSEREQLFNAILADPDCDTARLAFADLLQEQAEANPVRVMCRACEKPPDRVNHVPGHIFVGWGHGWLSCSVCGGCETVLDTADADLAELIRVQCSGYVGEKCLRPYPYADRIRCSIRLDHYKDDADRRKNWCKACHATIRERELLAAHPEWLRDLAMPCPGDGGGATRSAPRCGICGGMGDLLKRENPFLEEHTTGRGIVSRNPTLTRGLTISVECRLDEVVREVDVRCGRCNGVGEVVDYNAYPVPHQRKACPNCQQRKTVRGWQPTPWALAFRQACVGLGRVPAWRVTDREPQPLQGGGCYFQYWAEDLRAKLRVPEPIARKMASLELHSYSEHTSERHLNLHYRTPDAARHALELAVYRFVQGTPTNT